MTDCYILSPLDFVHNCDVGAFHSFTKRTKYKDFIWLPCTYCALKAQIAKVMVPYFQLSEETDMKKLVLQPPLMVNWILSKYAFYTVISY